jgi:hypothetical protein
MKAMPTQEGAAFALSAMIPITVSQAVSGAKNSARLGGWMPWARADVWLT